MQYPALLVASLGAAIVAAFGCNDHQPTAYNLGEPPASAPEPVETRWADFSGRVVCDFYEAPGPLRGFDPAKDPLCAKEPTDETLLIDEKTRGLRNVLVWVAAKPNRVHPRLLRDVPEEAVFDVKDCVYSPRITVVWINRQKFVLTNSDKTVHATSFAPGRGNNPPSAIFSTGARFVHSPKAPTSVPFEITCSVHPWEQAYGMYVDHPYYAITEADGSFVLTDLPVGEELEIRIWHERAGVINKWTGTLGPDGVELPEIRLSKSQLD